MDRRTLLPHQEIPFGSFMLKLVFSGSRTYGAATIDTNDLAGDIGSRRHTEE